MECVTTTSYSIVINGLYHGYFPGKRGLRQGDPLSSLLFTLCIEVLSRMLERMSRSPNFRFHPKCATLRITHLAYADDLLLFSYGDRISLFMIMQCLQNFGNTAGLRMNSSKSNIFMASIDDYNKQDILNITGFTIGTLPFRYLGIPIAAKRLCAADYSDLVDNVVTKKHPPIAWSMLCKTLADGGLGLKDLRAWNHAPLAKTLWNIHSKKDSLWIKWVNHIYSCFGGVWNWSSKHDDSTLIKNILLIRDELVRVDGSLAAATSRLHIWFDKSGGLSRAYDYFVHAKGVWPWKPLLAKSCILPKHRFILWLLAHSKLMTRDRLGFLSDRRCLLCEEEDETVAHLFFRCRISKIIWDNVRTWLDMRKTMASTTTILCATFRTVYKGNSVLAKMRITALSATVY
ncbi:uncharacterized protein LOC142550775 [Primulina tabacum]|uniref:uncharacterized protein LOC142550775 n=1 Tax=Primulina tabacum TaxID=48773 RepID=UPI003F5A74D7